MALYVRKDNDEKKQVISIYKGIDSRSYRTIASVYEGLKLIWQYIKSCYGRGYWITDKMWSNTDAWQN